MIGALLGKDAHKLTLVSILKAITEHMIFDLAMTEAHALAGFVQQIGGIAHALHTTGHNNIRLTDLQLGRAEHNALHPRTTQFVYRGRRNRHGNACTDGRLPCRPLAGAGRQNAPHQHFGNVIRVYLCPFQCRLYRHRTQFDRCQRRQFTLKSSHGCAGC